MFFTLLLENGLFERWRLQKDETFRKINDNDPVIDLDRRFTMPAELLKYHQPNYRITLDGKAVTANRTEGRLGEESYSLSGIAHRQERVIIPHEQELKSVLRNGDDSETSTLILSLDGRFELLPRVHINVVGNPSWAVRYETFDGGNDYVGPDAADDEDHVSQVYVAMLGGWVDHVLSGRLNVYVDGSCGQSEAELRETLIEWNIHWQS